MTSPRNHEVFQTFNCYVTTLVLACAGINLLDLAVAAVLPAVLLFLLAWIAKQVGQRPA